MAWFSIFKRQRAFDGPGCVKAICKAPYLMPVEAYRYDGNPASLQWFWDKRRYCILSKIPVSGRARLVSDDIAVEVCEGGWVIVPKDGGMFSLTDEEFTNQYTVLV